LTPIHGRATWNTQTTTSRSTADAQDFRTWASYEEPRNQEKVKRDEAFDRVKPGAEYNPNPPDIQKTGWNIDTGASARARTFYRG